jgi:hypothetical protein
MKPLIHHTLLFISLLFFSPISTGQMRKATEEPYIAGQLIVQLDEKSDLTEILSLLPTSYEFKINRLLSNHMRAWLIDFNPNVIDQFTALNLINRHQGITLCQNNHLIEIRSSIPNDPQFGQQWHHVNTGQNGGTIDADTDIDEVWSVTTGGKNALGHDIVVCILEQVNFSHNDLINNRWINVNEIPNNGIDDDNNGYVDDIYGWDLQSNSGNLPTGNSGHGTNVAGMIGAEGNNEIGVVGANWSVKMMNVTGYNVNSEASVVAAYNYPLSLRKLYNESNGKDGAFIVSTNASWGIDNANPNNYPIWCQFYDTLGKYGILNCGATTNSSINVDTNGDMPTACPSDYMIGIGRSGRNDNFAGGFGKTTINFAAPGIDVTTTANGNGYTSTTGTSFASPLTAGVVALLYSIPCASFMNKVLSNPQDGANLVLEALMNGTDPKTNLANYFITGGRLNAKKSFDILMNNCAPCQTSVVNITSSTDITTIELSKTPEAVNYKFYYRHTMDTDWMLINSTSTTIELTNLQSCALYEYYTLVSCSNEFGEASEISTFTTTGCESCSEIVYCETGTDTPIAQVSIQYPQEPHQTITTLTPTANWGSDLNSAYFAGDFVLVEDDSENGTEGCSTLLNPTELNGNIAVVTRSGCAFPVKAINVQNVGAKALLIINDQENGLVSLTGGGSSGDVTIPVAMISQIDGENLLNHLKSKKIASGLIGTQNEWIESIKFNNQLIISGNNSGYYGHNEHAITLFIGKENSFTLTPMFNGNPIDEYVQIWIDLNNDGTFDDNEILFKKSVPYNGLNNESIVLISNATEGLYRMRIQMANTTQPSYSACDQLAHGEVEDYCVNLVHSVNHFDNQETYIYPNPASEFFYFVTFSDLIKQLEVYSISGQLVFQQSITKTTTQINSEIFAKGVYFVNGISTDKTILFTTKLVIQ